MISISACTNLCTTAEGIFGPQVVEWACIAAIAGLTWWKTRALHATTAQATRDVKLVAEQAEKAKAEARDAKLQLAEIKGSLRPAAPPLGFTPSVPPILGTSSSQSGNFEPVTMPELGHTTPRPRPSMPDPSLGTDTPLPRPSATPDLGTTYSETEDTNPETPTSKRGK